MSEFVWPTGATVVMTGDSITDCGRGGDALKLGGGYVRWVDRLITARYPERRIRIINTGISGNCVDDLQGRWQADVLDHRPDWVTIMIGINDLHRTLNDIKHLPPTEFETRYRDILDQVRAAGAKLVLLDPFYMSLERGQGTPEAHVLDLLDGYLDVVARLAVDYDALHVKTQDAWLRVLEVLPPSNWCNEPVHPSADGHLVMANALLETLGF